MADNNGTVTLDDIRHAARDLRRYIEHTPLVRSGSLSRLTEADIYLKCENLQKTGSFKARGAFTKIIGAGGGHVSAASMGNHAQGVAYAASSLGVKARIFMPEGVSPAKEAAVRGYGAEVVLHGKNLTEAISRAKEEPGHEFIHPYDDPDIIRGQGTVGLETAEEAINPDCVIVPVGGGGLISGVSIAIKGLHPNTEVTGVQVASATSAMESFGKAEPVAVEPSPTLADGIAVGSVGRLPLAIINKHVDEISVVDEGQVAAAMLLLMERRKLVVEGAGAVGLAHVLSNRERYRGKKVLLIVSGGNVDFTVLDRIIHRALVERGRIAVFEAVLEDHPGELEHASGIVSKSRANILQVVHNRLGADVPPGKTRVKFTVEVRGRDHLEKIISEMKNAEVEARAL